MLYENIILLSRQIVWFEDFSDRPRPIPHSHSNFSLASEGENAPPAQVFATNFASISTSTQLNNGLMMPPAPSLAQQLSMSGNEMKDSTVSSEEMTTILEQNFRQSQTQVAAMTATTTPSALIQTASQSHGHSHTQSPAVANLRKRGNAPEVGLLPTGLIAEGHINGGHKLSGQGF